MTSPHTRPTVLPLIDLAGSRREIGHALGRFGRAAVHDGVVGSPAWCATLDHRGSDRARALRTAADAHVPELIEELTGLADGLGLALDDLFLWHCRGDLLWAAPEGCTTVRTPTPSGPLIVHNEDGDPAMMAQCCLARIRTPGAPEIVAFAYPGSLPGNAFGVNGAGLAVTVNNVRVRDGRAGVPRMLVGRAALDCRSIDAVIARVSSLPRGGGYNLNLAAAGDPRLIGLEFTATGFSTETIDRPSIHANHLIHPDLADLPQVVTASSGARQACGEALLAGFDPSDIEAWALSVTGDDAGPLPIRRADPQDPDGENTIATAVIRAEGERLTLTVRAGLTGEVLHEIGFARG